MSGKRLAQLSIVTLVTLLAGAVSAVSAAPTAAPVPPGVVVTAPDAPAGIGSLSGSFVVFDHSVGGDGCFLPGEAHTFCFRAESFTNDWEFVYTLWQRFPTDWTVTGVHVQGTPSCSSGGTWGGFAWAFETSPYEVKINHTRNQAATDHCVAYYCFNVVAGAGATDALVSWYWDGDEYGSPPHAPCSADRYTPPSMAGEPCDQWTNPQASVPRCILDPITLTPAEVHATGCSWQAQQHTLRVWNNTGSDTNVTLTYAITAGRGSCGGPPQVYVAHGTAVSITVELMPRNNPGETVECSIRAQDVANPANQDTSLIIQNVPLGYFDPAGWRTEPITNATPVQWAGGAVGTFPGISTQVGYVVGGLTTGPALNPDLQMFNPATGVWTQLADMPNPRFGAVVAWIEGYLVVAGGYDAGFVATNDLQVYNPLTNSWNNTTPANMPSARGGGAGGAAVCSSGVGTCLFHVGGGADSQFANTTLETWQYSPYANSWTQLDSKPAGSSPDGFILGAGVGCLGKIYVGGDYRGFHEFYRLDATQPTGSQWTRLADIPAGAGAMTPALVCKEEWGKIVLIGGDPNGYWGDYNNTVYVYDIPSNTWEGPLPQTLHVGQLGSVGWHLYNRVWTAGGTVGSQAISPLPFESLLQVRCGSTCLRFLPFIVRSY